MSKHEEKQVIRDIMKKNIKELSFSYKQGASQRIVSSILTSSLYQKASSLCGFYPLGSEPRISALFDCALQEGKQVYLPRCTDTNNLFFHRIEKNWRDHLFLSSYGISEPSETAPLVQYASDQSVLVLVPGIAFTPNKERMGRGKGFYDRYLAQYGNLVISLGVCFSLQVLASLPTEVCDKKVDYLVTEENMF